MTRAAVEVLFARHGLAILDSTVFSIVDTATGGTVVSEALDPSDGQFALPAGILATGRSYVATVYFVQAADFKLTFSGDYIHVGQAQLDSPRPST